MITIRLARTGVKKRPFFHITVADSRMPRDGRFIERVGYFNPIAKGKEIRLKVNQERLDYWLAQGAQVSSRVSSLFEEKDETPEQKIKKEGKKEKKRLRKVAKRKTEKSPSKEKAEEAAPEEKAEEAVKNNGSDKNADQEKKDN